MTEQFLVGNGASKDFIQETVELLQDTAEQLASSIRDIKAGNLDDAKAVTQVLKDLRVAFRQAMDERTRVEELRKQGAGVAYDFALDFDTARAEIGRRLACLRDAGDG